MHLSKLISVSSHFRLSSLHRFVCMIDRVCSWFDCQEFSHLKNRRRLLGTWIPFLSGGDKLICHRWCSSMSPRRIHQSLSIYLIHLCKFLFANLMLIAWKFAIKVSKHSFNRSAWSQRQSVWMIVRLQNFRIDSWCSTSLACHWPWSIVFHLRGMSHTNIWSLPKLILSMGSRRFLSKSLLVKWFEIFILSLKATHFVVVPFRCNYTERLSVWNIIDEIDKATIYTHPVQHLRCHGFPSFQMWTSQVEVCVCLALVFQHHPFAVIRCSTLLLYVSFLFVIKFKFMNCL